METFLQDVAMKVIIFLQVKDGTFETEFYPDY